MLNKDQIITKKSEKKPEKAEINLENMSKVVIKKKKNSELVVLEEDKLDNNVPEWVVEYNEKPKLGRPKKNESKVARFTPGEKRILSLGEHEINSKLLNSFRGPLEPTILFLDLLYQGASKVDAFICSRNKFNIPLPSDTQRSDSIYKLLNSPQNLAYLQLLNEQIIRPINLSSSYPNISYNSDEGKKVNLCYAISQESEEYRTLIKFYRTVILKKIINDEGAFSREEETLQTQLARSSVGDADALKQLLWRKISNPYKNASPQLIRNYMELCGMVDNKEQQDTKIEITFSDFNPSISKKESIIDIEEIEPKQLQEGNDYVIK